MERSGLNPSEPIMRRALERQVSTVTRTLSVLLDKTLVSYAEALRALCKLKDDFVASLKDRDEAARQLALQKFSSDSWSLLGDQALDLYRHSYEAEQKLEMQADSDTPEEAMTALSHVIKFLFQQALLALNGIRVGFVRGAQGKLGDMDALNAEFQRVVLDCMALWVSLAFREVSRAFIAAGKAMSLKLFLEEIWPPVKGGLEAIQSSLPDVGFELPLAKMAEKLFSIIVAKVAEMLLLKLMMAIERVSFQQ
jgi:hypothetical protein